MKAISMFIIHNILIQGRKGFTYYPNDFWLTATDMPVYVAEIMDKIFDQLPVLNLNGITTCDVQFVDFIIDLIDSVMKNNCSLDLQRLARY